MPLKSVKVGGLLEGPLAIVDIELTYINEDTESPIECSYEFPIDQDTVMSRLVAKIGDKEVEAKIKEKLGETDEKLKIKEAEIEFRVLEGQEEIDFLDKTFNNMKARKEKSRHGRKRHHGGRGGGSWGRGKRTFRD